MQSNKRSRAREKKIELKHHANTEAKRSQQLAFRAISFLTSNYLGSVFIFSFRDTKKTLVSSATTSNLRWQDKCKLYSAVASD
jgi:hypothetical protein